MAIDVLLKINNKDWTGSIIAPFNIGRHKLWGDDTGRETTMSGKMTGTLVGIFPKLTVILYPKDSNDLQELIKVLDTAWQTVQYYNPKTKALTTLGTYTNDYDIAIVNLEPVTEEIKVSFIATERE